MRAASTEEHRKRGKHGAISICLCLRRSPRPEDDIIYQNRLEIGECRWRRRPLWDLRISNRLSAPWHSFCEYQSDHPEQCDCHPVALNLRVVANLIRKLAGRLTNNKKQYDKVFDCFSKRRAHRGKVVETFQMGSTSWLGPESCLETYQSARSQTRRVIARLKTDGQWAQILPPL